MHPDDAVSRIGGGFDFNRRQQLGSGHSGVKWPSTAMRGRSKSEQSKARITPAGSLLFGTLGRFRPKSLDHCLVRLDVRAANQIDAVRHGSEDAVHELLAIGIFDAFERFPNRL